MTRRTWKKPPKWAKSFVLQLTEIRSDFTTKMNSMSNPIHVLNKDSRAMLNRLANAKKNALGIWTIIDTDRAHYALRPSPNPDQPLWHIIFHLSRWRDKQDIIRAATKRKELMWEGQRFLVYQHFSAEESRRCVQYNNLKKAGLRLYKAGVRFGVTYPATLIVTINKQKFTYTSSKDAARDLRKRLPKYFY